MPVKKVKQSEPRELRQMNEEDKLNAIRWEMSPEREAMLERNRNIADAITCKSGVYSNRC